MVTGKADSENSPVSLVTLKTGNETVENAIITQYTYDKFEAGTYMIRVTALAETNETGTLVTDTYTYDAYGNRNLHQYG